MLNCESFYKIEDFYNSTSSLYTREQVHHLFDVLKTCNCNKIEIDFSSVDIITRSYAHELQTLINKKLEEDKQMIIIVNANDSVAEMLRSVSTNERRKIEKVPILPYHDKMSLQNFLKTI